MDKYEYRRQCLMSIRDIYCGGMAANLARRINREPSYVNRMLSDASKPGHKRIGDDMIDIIEMAFNLPGWFSQGGPASKLSRESLDIAKAFEALPIDKKKAFKKAIFKEATIALIVSESEKISSKLTFDEFRRKAVERTTRAPTQRTTRIR